MKIKNSDEAVNLINREMKSVGMTKVQLSEAIGYSPSAMSRWFAFERKMPFDAISDALDSLDFEIHVVRKVNNKA